MRKTTRRLFFRHRTSAADDDRDPATEEADFPARFADEAVYVISADLAC
jgi:hypothetical protein